MGYSSYGEFGSRVGFAHALRVLADMVEADLAFLTGVDWTRNASPGRRVWDDVELRLQLDPSAGFSPGTANQKRLASQPALEDKSARYALEGGEVHEGEVKQLPDGDKRPEPEVVTVILPDPEPPATHRHTRYAGSWDHGDDSLLGGVFGARSGPALGGSGGPGGAPARGTGTRRLPG